MAKFLTLGLLISVFGFGALAQAKNGPITCFIQTYDGHYLTAVGGGGQAGGEALHSDATQGKGWEKFTLVDADRGTPNITYGIRTVKGYYLTAVDGGGRIQNVLHSDATQIRDWEEFQLHSLGNGWYSITTFTGNFLTAVNGGGRISDVIHSDAKTVKNWEKFKLKCGV